MKTRNLILSAAAVIAMCVPSAFAQQSDTSSTATPADKPATIAQRKDNQQDRIAQGIDSGQLTAGETKNLETKEAGVNQEERTMRSDDDRRRPLHPEQSAEPLVESDLRRQAQRQHGALRQR